MKKWLLIVIGLNISFMSEGQKIYWSDITQEDRNRAAATMERFSVYLSDQSYDSIPLLIMGDHINIDGEYKLSIEDFLIKLRKQMNNATVNNKDMVGYTFEDFLENYKNNELIQKVYPVFNNHSILFHLLYNNNRVQEEMVVIMKKNKAGNWKISGFSGLEIETDDKEAANNRSFREENIPMAGITLYLPENFIIHDESENQINYYMKGQTERDAVLQVMVDNIQGKLPYYTYKFVEFNNQYNDLSNLTVRYLPYGLLYDYEVKDAYGTKNKGITVGLENKGNFIILQFYSFYDVYEEIENKIDFIFRNVIKEKS